MVETCKICGHEALPNHMKQYHKTLTEYGHYEAYESKTRAELKAEIKKQTNFINVAGMENPMNMGPEKEKLEALKNELASLGEGLVVNDGNSTYGGTVRGTGDGADGVFYNLDNAKAMADRINGYVTTEEDQDNPWPEEVAVYISPNFKTFEFGDESKANDGYHNPYNDPYYDYYPDELQTPASTTIKPEDHVRLQMYAKSQIPSYGQGMLGYQAHDNWEQNDPADYDDKLKSMGYDEKTREKFRDETENFTNLWGNDVTIQATPDDASYRSSLFGESKAMAGYETDGQHNVRKQVGENYYIHGDKKLKANKPTDDYFTFNNPYNSSDGDGVTATCRLCGDVSYFNGDSPSEQPDLYDHLQTHYQYIAEAKEDYFEDGDGNVSSVMKYKLVYLNGMDYGFQTNSKKEAEDTVAEWNSVFRGEPIKYITQAEEFNIGTDMICPVCHKEIDAGNDEGFYHRSSMYDSGSVPLAYKMEQHMQDEHSPEDFGVKRYDFGVNGWIGNNAYDAFHNSFPEYNQDDAIMMNNASRDTLAGDLLKSDGTPVHDPYLEKAGYYESKSSEATDLFDDDEEEDREQDDDYDKTDELFESKATERKSYADAWNNLDTFKREGILMNGEGGNHDYHTDVTLQYVNYPYEQLPQPIAYLVNEYMDYKGHLVEWDDLSDEQKKLYAYYKGESLATESSVNCFNCQTRVWDKYTGLMNGSYEKDGKTICGNCGTDVFSKSYESYATEKHIDELFNEWTNGKLLTQKDADEDPENYYNTINWWAFAKSHGINKDEADKKMREMAGEAGHDDYECELCGFKTVDKDEAEDHWYGHDLKDFDGVEL